MYIPLVGEGKNVLGFINMKVIFLITLSFRYALWHYCSFKWSYCLASINSLQVCCFAIIVKLLHLLCFVFDLSQCVAKQEQWMSNEGRISSTVDTDSSLELLDYTYG